MLMIGSIITAIIYTDNIKVIASDGGGQGNGGEYPLDFVWNLTQKFANVIRDADWSDENNIPKGRAWATAGENYTRREILYKNMGGPDNPCGLTDYTNLTIGYISGPNGLDPESHQPHGHET